MFESLYRDLLLRDILGKVLPGLAIFLALGIALSDLSCVLEKMTSLPAMAWTVAIGLGWFVGMAMQSLGEFVRFIQYYPREGRIFRCVARYRGPTLPNAKPWKCVRKELKSKPDLSNLQAKLSNVYFESDFEFYEFINPILKECPTSLERDFLLREACGNGCFALLVALPISLWRICDWPPATLPILITVFLLLWRMYRKLLRRQQESAAALVTKNLWADAT